MGTNQLRVTLWEAINDYATACGGNPQARGYGKTARMDAVCAVETALGKLLEESSTAPTYDPAKVRELLYAVDLLFRTTRGIEMHANSAAVLATAAHAVRQSAAQALRDGEGE